MRLAPVDMKADYVGFPEESLLESGRLPIEQLAELALREGQSSNPVHRVHRWFARRLGTQFRGILCGLTLPADAAGAFWNQYFGAIPLRGAVVLDPFVGGGTALLEAARCGAQVIGYDIDPVATLITRFELGLSRWSLPPSSLPEVCEAVSTQIRPFHKTVLPDGTGADVLHHFWVEMSTCPSCGRAFEAHPHYQLAHDIRKGLQWVFCRDCHEIYQLPICETAFACQCGARSVIRQGTLSRGTATCPSCGERQTLSARGRAHKAPPLWRLFAQEYLAPSAEGTVRKFKKATDDDVMLFAEAEDLLEMIEREEGAFVPRRPIPTWPRVDQRPLMYGFMSYDQLFNSRQLLHLTLLGRAISSLRNEAEKEYLALAFSEHLTTNCMYAGYAFGYRRISPMFSIHSYRHICRPVELNPWLANTGRGTFPNVLAKLRRAVAYATAPSDLDPDGGRRPSVQTVGSAYATVASDASSVIQGKTRAAVVTQSSTDLAQIRDQSIDLILTDPPYFDNVSYSELSDFYLSWHQVLGIAQPPYDDLSRSSPIQGNLAVIKRDGERLARYREQLTEVLLECRRVLRYKGLCVFTYHHTSVEAWSALGAALAASGLVCTGVIPLRGEGQGGFHSYDGTVKWDAVFVYRKVPALESRRPGEAVVARDALEKALAALRGYVRRLGRKGRIGFRKADQLNLLRALVVSHAFQGCPSEEALPLQTILGMTSECIDS